KSFNLAGNNHAHLFIPDETLRRDWTRNNYNGHPNALSNEATIAAYDRSEDWLDELRAYLDETFAMMKQMLNEHLPQAEFAIAQGTYLAWVDLSDCGLSELELKRRISQAGVCSVWRRLCGQRKLLHARQPRKPQKCIARRARKNLPRACIIYFFLRAEKRAKTR
ncbi:MAG: hypothetical protein Q8S22_10155, partial [Eubacteriales bacterium]|nr:hypothetical protein [Eubacteriales bacterium]